jgi:hypothetical protein
LRRHHITGQIFATDNELMEFKKDWAAAGHATGTTHEARAVTHPPTRRRGSEGGEESENMLAGNACRQPMLV